MEPEASAFPCPGPVAAGISPLHRLDPRVRLLAAAGFAMTVVGLSDFLALGGALAAAVATLVLARLPPGPTLRRMAAMDGFIVVMLLLLPFTLPGPPLLTFAGVVASATGVQAALIIALKANAAVLMLLVLVGTLEPAAFGHACHRLGAPDNLVHLLLFTVRYIAVIADEARRMRVAMKVRGFRPGNNCHTYRTFGYLVGMLLVRALERSERILQAMKCRGFSGRIPLLDSLRYQKQDGVFVAMLFAVILVLLWLEFRHVVSFSLVRAF